MKSKKRFLVAASLAVAVILPSASFAEDAKPNGGQNKMQQLHEKGSAAPALKTLDADNKRLEKSFADLLVKEGYSPTANCKTTCSVSCTWVNGVCQPTTTCSVTCGY